MFYKLFPGWCKVSLTIHPTSSGILIVVLYSTALLLLLIYEIFFCSVLFSWRFKVFGSVKSWISHGRMFLAFGPSCMQEAPFTKPEASCERLVAMCAVLAEPGRLWWYVCSGADKVGHVYADRQTWFRIQRRTVLISSLLSRKQSS